MDQATAWEFLDYSCDSCHFCSHHKHIAPYITRQNKSGARNKITQGHWYFNTVLSACASILPQGSRSLFFLLLRLPSPSPVFSWQNNLGSKGHRGRVYHKVAVICLGSVIVVLLNASLYGLNQAARVSFNLIVATHTSSGFEQCKSDPCALHLLESEVREMQTNSGTSPRWYGSSR